MGNTTADTGVRCKDFCMSVFAADAFFLRTVRVIDSNENFEGLINFHRRYESL